MRRHNLNYVLVGTFVTAMVVATIVVIAMITGRTGPADPYFIVLDNVADVKFGTQIRYEGYPIGQVERVEPFGDGGRMRFRVDVAVRRGWQIPEDSLARIGSSSFLAAKTIEIEAGRLASVVAVGGEIRGAPSSDVFAAVATVAGEVGALTRESIRPLIDQIGALVARVDTMVGEDVGGLLGTLRSVAALLEQQVPAIAGSADELLDELKLSAAGLRQMTGEENVEALRRLLSNAEAASTAVSGLVDDFRSTTHKVDAVIAGLDQMIAQNRGNVDQSVADLRYSLRAIARSIGTITHNLEGTSRNMNEFSRLIRQNPGILLGGGAPSDYEGASSSGALPQ